MFKFYLFVAIIIILMISLGWLIDSTVRFPMQGPRSGCCGTSGICGSPIPADETNKYNAWCYKE